MFIKIILSYITGYLRVNIEGYYIERFINLCNLNNITIWNLKKNKNLSMLFNVGVDDFKEITKIAKKLRCRTKIKKRKGFRFLLYRYKKRKIFFILFIMILVSLLASTNYIWNINIEQQMDGNPGDQKYLSDEDLKDLKGQLEEEGLKVGAFKNNIDPKDLASKIRLKRSDISWIGVDIKGTSASVKFVMAEERPEIIDQNEICNVISDKAGIITKIHAQNGTSQVKAGDTVNVGTVLIGGWLEGKYTGNQYVHAAGEIEAKVFYTDSVTVPYKSTEDKETGQEETNYKIKIQNFEINFPKGVSNYEFYDTIETEQKLRLFSDFYLPISLVKITNKELKKQEVLYTADQAKDLGEKQLEDKLLDQIENKDNIVNKNVNTYTNVDSVEVFVTYEVIENIGTNEKIIF